MDTMDFLSTGSIVSTLFITFLALVLSLNNIIAIVSVTLRVDPGIRHRAQRTALWIALFLRLVVLWLLVALISLDSLAWDISGHTVALNRILILAGGGFLIFQSIQEFLGVGRPGRPRSMTKAPIHSISAAVFQILFLNMLMSFDSIVTVAGIGPNVAGMSFALLVEGLVIVLVAGAMIRLVERFPASRAAGIIVVFFVGATMVAESFMVHIPQGYIHAAAALMVLWVIAGSSIRQRINRVKARLFGEENLSVNDRSETD